MENMNIFSGPLVKGRSEGREGKIDGIEGEEEARGAWHVAEWQPANDNWLTTNCERPLENDKKDAVRGWWTNYVKSD